MGINTDLILAGISAGGASGAELAWFAPSGTTAPTDTDAALTAATNEQQTVTITGTPTGGTFTLTYGGQTTAGIAYNAVAGAVQSALVALTSVGTGAATVTGGPGPGTAYVVTFKGILGGQNIAQMTASAASLTGGTSPAVTVTTTTPGVSGFVSAGLVSEDGLTKDVKDSSNEIRAYGLAQVARRIVTSEDITFKLTFLETNTVSLAIYNRLPLFGATSVQPDTSGVFSISEGTFRSPRYACVFDMVDGVNKTRIYAPSVEISEKDGFTTKVGEATVYGVTATAYANSSGVSVQTFYKIPALASS